MLAATLMPEPQDERALDARLAELKAERDRQAAADARRTAGTAMGLGFKIGMELVVAVAICAGIGFAIDRYAGTRPWAMILGLLLGFGAGLRNVFRSAESTAAKWSAAEAADRARKDV